MDNDAYQYQNSPRPDVQLLVPAAVKTMLDVGCGSAAFGAGLKQARPGLVVWGIDPAPYVEAHARERLDHFILGRFPDDLPSQKFDCVTFCDALEHFENPWTALGCVTDLLNDRGFVVASVPNIRFYNVVRRLVFNGEFTYTEQGILDRTHLRFFTRRSLEELFSSCGFTVLSVTPQTHAKPGRALKILALLGRLSIEFRSTHFNVVARLCSPSHAEFLEG